jgi:ribosomal protein S27AE
LKLLKNKFELLSTKAEQTQTLYENSLETIKVLEKGCAVCNKPNYQHEVALQKFVHQNVDKSKVVSMIYGICKNNGNGLGYSYMATHQNRTTKLLSMHKQNSSPSLFHLYT